MLSLTAAEHKLCQFLTLAAQSHPSTPTLRIAGGWVRDKLLGLESHDLDIALDTCKGEAFAHHVSSLLKDHGSISMGTIATIQVNPEKSKHLETATVKILDFPIDFVHLRTEIYSDDSRNPIVDFGTPLQDALRRDITINALFYNIQTQKVEDFTGMGLDDLKNGIVRTPLDPYQTFIDDPLRVLRVVRFATRFNYKLDPAILEAVKNPEIKTAFEKKITRERIGIEIDKMMSGPDPLRAIETLHEFGFTKLVCSLPESLLESYPSPNYKHSVDLAKTHLELAKTLDPLLFDLNRHHQFHRFIYLACMLAPFQKMLTKVKSKTVPVSRWIVANSLKLSIMDADICSNTLEMSSMVAEKVREHVQVQKMDRKTLGLFLRMLSKGHLFSAHQMNEKWDMIVYFAVVQEITNSSPELKRSIIEKYESFMRDLRSMKLENVHDLKPLLDVAAALGLKPGPTIGGYLQRIIEWQLEYPEGNADMCLEWLKTLKQESH